MAEIRSLLAGGKMISLTARTPPPPAPTVAEQLAAAAAPILKAIELQGSQATLTNQTTLAAIAQQADTTARLVAEMKQAREDNIATHVEAAVAPERAARVEAEQRHLQAAQQHRQAEQRVLESTTVIEAERAARSMLQTERDRIAKELAHLKRTPPKPAPPPSAPVVRPQDIEVTSIAGAEGRIAQFVLKASGQEEVRINVQRDATGRFLKLIQQRK